jgi:hypothetical protein
MGSTPHRPDRSTGAAAAACGSASPLQVTAAAPLWRALSDEGALWLLTSLPPRRAVPKRQARRVGGIRRTLRVLLALSHNVFRK